MRTSRGAIPLVITALLLAGCGGDDDTSTTTTVPEATTTVPDATTTTADGNGPAESGAEAAVLQADDLPAGWEANPEEERLDHETTWQALLACAGVTDPAEGEVENVSSPTFQTGLATLVTSAVSYYDSPEQVAALAEAFTGDDLAACAEEALLADVERNKPPEATLSDLVVTPGEFPEFGEATVSYRIDGTINIGPVAPPLYQDFVAVFDGDAVSRFNFLNPGTPFPEDLQRTLVETVVERA